MVLIYNILCVVKQTAFDDETSVVKLINNKKESC